MSRFLKKERTYLRSCLPWFPGKHHLHTGCKNLFRITWKKPRFPNAEFYCIKRRSWSTSIEPHNFWSLLLRVHLMDFLEKSDWLQWCQFHWHWMLIGLHSPVSCSPPLGRWHSSLCLHAVYDTKDLCSICLLRCTAAEILFGFLMERSDVFSSSCRKSQSQVLEEKQLSLTKRVHSKAFSQ